MSAAHEKALASVLEYNQTHVIQQNEVLRLTSLRLIYVGDLKENGCEKSNYRSEKLLKRLQSDPMKDYIQFTKVEDNKGDAIGLSLWLVFSANITVSHAIARAYSIGSTDNEDVALDLRDDILHGRLLVSQTIYLGHQQLMTWSSMLKGSCLQTVSGSSTWLCPGRKTQQ